MNYSLSSANTSICLQILAIFVILGNKYKNCFLIRNLWLFLTFIDFLKDVLISVIAILTMSAKLAAPGLLEIIVFWNKDYEVIISVNDVTNKILSSDLNYIEDVVMWPKFDDSSFLWKKLSQLQFYTDLIRKTIFFEGRSWFGFNNLVGLALGKASKFYQSMAKRLKLEV